MKMELKAAISDRSRERERDGDFEGNFERASNGNNGGCLYGPFMVLGLTWAFCIHS